MAVKISELSASAQITSDDFLPIVDSGSLTTKRASAQQVLEYVTGSTFNSLSVTSLTGSSITGSTALFTAVTASHVGSGAGLTNIPNSGLVNDSVTVGSTTISLGATATTIQGLSVLTGSTVTGSTALFDNITASVALFTGDIRVLGTASITQLNTVGQQSLLVGDKYITILSGGVDHTGINGAGFLWGTSSGPGETTGTLGEHAHVLYDASRDALEIFPGLYVTGSTTVFGISGTTAQFTTITGSTVTGTLAQFTTVSASTAQISGNLVIYGSASLAEYPDYAYVLYTASYDKIVVYPGLYVSGNLTGSGLGAFQTVSASTYIGVPTTSPGGTNTTIQFNSGSTFSGSSNLVWDYTNERLGIGTTSPTRFIEAVKNDNGTVAISVKNTADQANASAILEAVNSASNGFQLGVAAPLATNGGNRYSGGETFFQANLASANFISMYRSDVTPNGNKLKFKIHESLGSTTTTALEIGHTASIFNPNSVVNYGLNVNGNTIISGNLTVTGSTTLSTVSGTTAEFTTVSASVISASSYVGIPSALPGGTNTTVQFNSGSTFSGSNNLIYNYTTNILSGTTAQFTTLTSSTAYFSGSVGIGTSTPNYLFEVRRDQNSSNYLGVTNTTNGTSSLAGIYVNNGAKGFSISYRPAAYTDDSVFADSAVLRTDSTITGSLSFESINAPIRFYHGSIRSLCLEITSSETVINQDGRTMNFRVESDNNENMFLVDSSLDRISINKASPNATLDVNGNTIISGTLTVTGSIFVSGSSIYGQVAELTSSTTNYTLVRQDSGKFLNINSGSAVTVTVPTGLPTGFTVSLCQLGAGQVTVSGAVGVTINNRQSHTKTAGQYAVVSLVGTSADTYVFVGDTSL